MYLIVVIHKLKTFGINSQLLAWIQESFLNRSFCVLVNGCSHAPAYKCDIRSPQGSVLAWSPAFFLYINDLPEVLDCDKTSVRLFAYDEVLYRPINTLMECQFLQKLLCRVARWAENWQLVFNTSKCIATSLSPAHTQFTYSSGNTALASTETFTYMGVLVHSSLSYQKHINHP